jgi:thymidine phosphorylase
VVVRADAGALGRAATLLGAGRLRKEDDVDPGVGITLHVKVGDPVGRGEPLCTIRCDDGARWAAARPLVEAAFRLGRRAPRRGPLVLETVD